MHNHSGLLRPELSSQARYNSGLTLADVAQRCAGLPIAKLGSNENPHPLPSAVQDAMAQAMRKPHLYPDPDGRELAAALAKSLQCDPEQIVFGNGSEDILAMLARAILRPGDEVVTLYPSFPLHESYAQMMGAHMTRIAIDQRGQIPMGKLLEAVARPVRLSLFANPMNPAGVWLDGPQLDAVLAAQHPDSLLCIDEAYVEYARGSDYRSALDALAQNQKPLLVLRTFSKAYGLAALRAGYGVTNSADVRRGLDLARTPFNINAIAQSAALVALETSDAMETAVTATNAERGRVAAALTALGLPAMPSRGNFLFLDTGQPSSQAADFLLSRGVIVKPWRQPGFDSWIRVSIGLAHENDQFLGALAEWVDCAK